MSTRIIVGLIALPFVLAPIWFGGVWCALLVAVAALAAGYEFYGMMEQGDYHPAPWLGLPWMVAIALAGWWPAMPWLSTILMVGSILTLVYALFQIEKPASTWMSTSVGAIYIGLMLGQGLALRLLPSGLWWLLFGMLVTWVNDIAAYFTGSTLGRHKLWPRLSPKKSWEGTVGGWIGSALIGGLLTLVLPLPIPVVFGAGLGFACGILALFGDLSISMLKRQIGVKDTGTFFPGHGGVLDRLDSLLFVLPFVYQVVLFLHLV
ncbi:MAG: phosphatidate cytidylyltransferase [Chloroflexi bacterium]|nr:phosphatidate cytidylyltransferase [Chloroflexota bacterium]